MKNKFIDGNIFLPFSMLIQKNLALLLSTKDDSSLLSQSGEPLTYTRVYQARFSFFRFNIGKGKKRRSNSRGIWKKEGRNIGEKKPVVHFIYWPSGQVEYGFIQSYKFGYIEDLGVNITIQTEYSVGIRGQRMD